MPESKHPASNLQLPFASVDNAHGNVHRLIVYCGNSSTTDDINEMRQAYIQSLNSIQRCRIPLSNSASETLDYPRILFDIADKETRALLECFLETGDVQSGDLFAGRDATKEIVAVKEGLAMLQAFDAGSYRLARLLVNCFLLARKPLSYGGSRGDCLGVIWINPGKSWTVSDYAEIILHETIHQALFLDEMINSMFTCSPPRMSEPDALVLSAIRKTMRPYYLSFHAACVAYSLIGFYRWIGKFGKASRLRASVVETVKQLRHKDEFLTGHGKRLLSFMEANIEPPPIDALREIVPALLNLERDEIIVPGHTLVAMKNQDKSSMDGHPC